MDPKTEFVFYRDEKNNVYSGGYKINNLFKKLDIPPIYQKGGGNSLVLPLGLFYQTAEKEEDPIDVDNNNDEIPENLYNELLKLSMKNKSDTRKNRPITHRKTRKKK